MSLLAYFNLRLILQEMNIAFIINGRRDIFAIYSGEMKKYTRFEETTLNCLYHELWASALLFELRSTLKEGD